MTQRAGDPGLAAGLGSSVWSSPPPQPPQTQPLQQVLNTSTPNFAPHLRQAGQQAQIQESKTSGYVPPHLRGFNTLQKENVTLKQHVPPHLQGFNTPSKENMTSGRPVPPHLQVTPAVAMNSQCIGAQQHSTADHNAPMAAKAPAAALAPGQPVSKAKPTPEEEFVKMMQKKDAEITRKPVAKKGHSAMVQSQPVQSPPAEAQKSPLDEVQPYMLLPPKKEWKVNDESNKNFQAFIGDKFQSAAVNGKKYTFTGGKESPQTLPAASEPCRNGTLQVASSNRRDNTTPFGKVDPHSAFSPQDLATKVGPSDRWNMMRPDYYAPSPPPPPPSVDASIAPGFDPYRSSECFDNKISDTGVEEKPKENVRAFQGQDTINELVDWDGKMMPPPVDWETDRVAFDNSFMPKYIREDWEPKLPRGPTAAIDTGAEEFQLAVPVVDTTFVVPPEQPLTIPDYANSENEPKQRRQTAEGASAVAAKRQEKRSKAAQGWAQAHQAHNLAVMSKEPEPHPYAPTIDVYLRPATVTDAKCIADIYNHYVQSPHSIVTEDQTPISEDDVAYLINHCKSEKLPIIVAVRGKMPLPPPTKSLNRAQQNGKAPLPRFEGIIGFGYAETYNYGIGGGRNGRSRFTANIHFYVHHEYTGNKVGQSLLDRLIQSLSHGYGAKDGYDWVDPANDPIYLPGGVQRWHQIIIQFAVQPKNDPNYERMRDFLRRYFFDEEGRISRIGRSSVNGPSSPSFADIIFFVKEASALTEFSPIV